jgi:hypothetical protein
MYGNWTQAARHTQADIRPFVRVLPPPQLVTPRYSVRDRILTEKGWATVMHVMVLRPKGDGRIETVREPMPLYDVWFDNGAFWLIREDDLELEVVMWARETTGNLTPVPTHTPAA